MAERANCLLNTGSIPHIMGKDAHAQTRTNTREVLLSETQK